MNKQKIATLVLLHGWGSKAHSWHVIKQKLELSGYRCLSVLFPGFDLPQPPEPWGVPEYADYVLSKLEQLQVKPPFTFVGHSFGGRVSIYIAATHPELVDKLILTDSAGVENRRTPKLLLVNTLSKLFKMVDGIQGVNKISRPLRKFIWRFTASPDYSNASPVMREILKKVVTLNLEQYLPNIRAETLVIWGDKDEVTRVRDARILNRGIRGSHLVMIRGAGHNAHITHVYEWLRHAITFLEK
ncbi:hypothetical protein A2415_01575 [candidate division WWE3 bacterium RIFOXYC1_FULL_39_7]|uniref:AB hydrolase-1 domain-containing protein n=1 Tax=candidate division WWE3 bacterium RIFOXYC1_FULL_39_7 TaxID=1802643 RepID=A0A1F4WKV5_UNCKA|nr:MAG: hypothetical protein A2415_01575 [candidate division WWE3 bacterium RIFOXYC1_FULL_39_7]